MDQIYNTNFRKYVLYCRLFTMYKIYDIAQPLSPALLKLTMSHKIL